MKSSPIILALLLCCALALARMLGVHVHIAHSHAAAVEALDADPGHDHGTARVVSELGDHADSHLSHAEFDADSADQTSGKLPSLLQLAFVSCIAAFLIPARRRMRWRVRYEAPPLRRRSHVLPLSQAPPLAA